MELGVAIVLSPSLKLQSRPAQTLRIGDAPSQPPRGVGAQGREPIGVCGLPGRIVAHIAHGELSGKAGLRGQPLQLMQGIGCPSGASRGRATKHQPAHLFRVAEGKMLSHHATKGNSHHGHRWQAEGIMEGGEVVGVIGHGVGASRHIASALAALIEAPNLVVVRQGPI
jgi:hypothetical protein